LNANLALNGLFNVLALRSAASETSQGMQDYHVGDPSRKRNFGAFSLRDVPRDIPINEDNNSANQTEVSRSAGHKLSSFPITALDDVHFLKDRCPHLMKLDVEGAERGVLIGSTSLITRCKPILYIENQCTTTSMDLIKLLFSMNYTCFWDPSPYFSPDNYMKLPLSEMRTPGISLNMLCLQKEGPERTPEDQDECNTQTCEGDSVRDTSTRWMVLRDVTNQLVEITPDKFYIEQYNPVKFRSDAGLPPPFEAHLKMADC